MSTYIPQKVLGADVDSGDRFVPLAGIRNDNLADTINPTNQKYGTVAVDGNGRLALIGAVQAGISTYSQGSSGSRMNGALAAVFDDVSPVAPIENRFDALRMSGRRDLYVESEPHVASGTIDAPTETVVIILTGASATVGVYVSGSYTGQLEFESTIDDTTWFSHDVQVASTNQFVNATVGTGAFVAQVGGFLKFRVRGSALSAGAAVVTLFDSLGAHIVNLGAGDATIGTVLATATGNVAHDASDAGNPVKIGAKAVAHGSSPTAVAAGDRTDLYANRHGIPFVIGGHMNTIRKEWVMAASQTNLKLIDISSGSKLVVTSASALVDADCTVNVAFRLGLAASALPTISNNSATGLDGIVIGHPDCPPGSGVVEGDGAGIICIGADGDDLFLTSDAASGGSLHVKLSGYLIES